MFCGLLAQRLIGERLPAAWAASTACAVGGCALLLLPGGSGAGSVAGLLLALVAGVCYAVYTVCAKRLLGSGADPLAMLAGTLGLGAIVLSPVLLTQVGQLATARGAGLVLWLAVGATAGAYALFVHGLGRVPAATAGTLTLAEPLTAALLGVLVLSEHLSLLSVTGGVLLVFGLTASRSG